jgi:ribose transport system substrate-binding protein
MNGTVTAPPLAATFGCSGMKNRCSGEEFMLLPRSLAVGVAALGLAVALASSGHTADITKAKLYPDKKGTVADLLPITKFCGTKPIKVALSDGWGGNYWRHITRAEFEDEASKCKNITETRYTDGEFKPEKQIADIEGLIAQKFDVIVTFLTAAQRF